MENEKENKKKTLKKTFFEVVYWCLLGLITCFGLLCGFKQVKTWQNIENRLSNIEETLNNKEESALARGEVRRALPLRDSAVTDLTNTTWLFDDSIGLSYAWGNFSLNFTSNNQSFTSLKFYMDEDEAMHDIVYDTSAKYSGSWVAQAWRTISISGGTHATNTTLIEYLNTCATLQEEPQPEPEPEPVGISYSLEKRYDFRKWFGEVDPLTGVVNMTASTSNPQYFYDIGAVSVGGITYDHIAISFIRCTNAINIISGYDFQNQCYLAIGGGDYYNGSTNYYVCIAVDLIVGNSYPTTNKLVLYSAPMVGARMQYESGNPISPTDYTPATGFLCSTYELKETGINWTNYLPSETKYNFPGIGDDYSVYEVLQLDLLNDTYLDFYSVSASATGGNVFDLIGNAFKTLVPLLGIQVIPGIPIGLLVVLPITATILIVVIKLVRK